MGGAEDGMVGVEREISLEMILVATGGRWGYNRGSLVKGEEV